MAKFKKQKKDNQETFRKPKREKFEHEMHRQIQLTPVTSNQKRYVDALQSNALTIVTGPPGCCKSILAAEVACKDLMNHNVRQIVLTRSATSTSRGIGFVPGTADEKCQHWFVSMLAYFKEILGKGVFESQLHRENIVLAPLENMMGRSFDDSWVIVEEAQLMTVAELVTITTRLGRDSRMTINGDYRQNIKSPDFKNFVKAIEKYEIDDVQVIRMTEDDILRSKLVKDLTLIYNREALW